MVFLIILASFSIIVLGIFSFIAIQKFDEKIKEKTKRLHQLRFEIVNELRKLSKQIEELEKSSKKLESNSDFINNYVYVSLINILPFKKLRMILLLNELIKKMI